MSVFPQTPQTEKSWCTDSMDFFHTRSQSWLSLDCGMDLSSQQLSWQSHHQLLLETEPFLGVKVDVVPSLLPIHFRYTTLMLLRSNFYSTIEVAGDRWTQIWDNQKRFTIVPRNPKPASSFSSGHQGSTQVIKLAQPAPVLVEPS